jgi:hypothetical protein
MEIKLLCLQAWKLALLRYTKSVHTLVVVFQSARAHSGLNALATVRSTTELVRKKVGLLLVAWTCLA